MVITSLNSVLSEQAPSLRDMPRTFLNQRSELILRVVAVTF